MASASSPNSLGLDFHQLQIQDLPSSTTQADTTEIPHTPSPGESTPLSEVKEDHTEAKDKKKAYVNHERVKTGGNQRDKLSEAELVERMVRMREQNEKIKQRRMDVQADEAAFRKTQESERAKLAQIRKVQENIDRTRDQNAKRKMDKIQSREWDSGKPTSDWKRQAGKLESTQHIPIPAGETGSFPEHGSPPQETAGRTRGTSHRSRRRIRGQGGSGAVQEVEGSPAKAYSTVPGDSIETEISQPASSVSNTIHI